MPPSADNANGYINLLQCNFFSHPQALQTTQAAKGQQLHDQYMFQLLHNVVHQ